MAKKEQKSALKILAADAKARMKNGYHTESKERGKPASYFEVVKKSVKQDAELQKEQAFKEKVRGILHEGGVRNPILRLVDETVLNGLDYSARQRYLMSVSEKFKRVKEEIEAEERTAVEV